MSGDVTIAGMRLPLVLVVLASIVLAQGMPPASRVDSWKSAFNQKRLRIQWEILPKFKPTKNPDGSENPPKAPWPFLIYVYQQETKGSEKLAEKVFSDTRFALACRPVKPVKVKPGKAIDIPYLASVSGIKDPTIIVVNRDFKVVGVLRGAKNFTANKVIGLMDRATAEAYGSKLGAYAGKYVKLIKEEEKLWAQGRKAEAMRNKAAKAGGAKGKKIDKEADAIEARVGSAREDIGAREIALQDSLALKGEKAEVIPDRIKIGKKSRKLTPQELEAIAAFKEFARNDNPVVRAAAVEDLGGIDSAVMVQYILKASDDVDMRVVEGAGRALGRMKSEESLAAMLEGLGSSKAKAKLAALLGFAHGKRPYPPAVKPIVAMLRGGGDDVRRSALRALRNQRNPAATPALIEALDDKLPGLRVMAATALGELRAKSAAAPLIERLKASDWSLRKAAAEALGRIRVKESIEPLLVAFENAKGLQIEVLYKALVAVTGEDFRYSAKGWRRWWDRWGGSFKVPTDAQVEIAKKKAAEAMKGYHDPRKKKYATIETLSRKLVFVIDISASMNEKIVIPPQAPDSVRDEFPNRVKIEIAKRELVTLLATLEPNVFFNIITFAGKVKPWRDSLVPASQKNAAIKFVSKLKAKQPPRGGRKASSGEEQKTNTYGALTAAFGLQDAAIPNWKSRTKVDTIFIVTDGVPTTGKITDVPKLISTITEMNAGRGVVIHVVVFDKQEAKQLGPLASRNGGQCVVRGWNG